MLKSPVRSTFFHVMPVVFGANKPTPRHPILRRDAVDLGHVLQWIEQECSQQGGREVVDAVVAKILEALGNGALSRAREARHQR